MSYAEYGEMCIADEKGALTELGYVWQKITSEQIYDGTVPQMYRISEAAKEQPLPKPEKSDKGKKPSLMNRLDEAKSEAAALNAERKDVPKAKKRGDMEVD